MWGSAVSDAGFLRERHLLMLPFKWTANSMNISCCFFKFTGLYLNKNNLTNVSVIIQ